MWKLRLKARQRHEVAQSQEARARARLWSELRALAILIQSNWPNPVRRATQAPLSGRVHSSKTGASSFWASGHNETTWRTVSQPSSSSLSRSIVCPPHEYKCIPAIYISVCTTPREFCTISVGCLGNVMLTMIRSTVSCWLRDAPYYHFGTRAGFDDELLQAALKES